MSGTTVTDPTPTDAREGYALVDCDVHPLIGDIAGLRKYMSKRGDRRVFGEQVQVYLERLGSKGLFR